MVEGLEETRTQLVFVTEAVFCSLGNLLTAFQGLPAKACPRLAPHLHHLATLAGTSELTGQVLSADRLSALARCQTQGGLDCSFQVEHCVSRAVVHAGAAGEGCFKAVAPGDQGWPPAGDSALVASRTLVPLYLAGMQLDLYA